MVKAMNTVANQVLEYLYRPRVVARGLQGAMAAARLSSPSCPSWEWRELRCSQDRIPCERRCRPFDDHGISDTVRHRSHYGRAPGAKLDALNLGRRLFCHSERLRFTVSTQEGIESAGCQNSREYHTATMTGRTPFSGGATKSLWVLRC